MNLAGFLDGRAPPDISRLLLNIASTSVQVRRALPFSANFTDKNNPSGERQTELDVYANELFSSSLLSTGLVGEVASEELDEPLRGVGKIHVAMDPLDGSSNIATNNPLGSIFGFYSSRLPCSGKNLVGAAFITYGPMLTLTYSTGEGVHTFVAQEGKEGDPFVLIRENVRIPESPEVFGLGGQRKEWIEPVEAFVRSLEGRGMKLRYGGTFVGDYNQVLTLGGIFGYPALKHSPNGKLRILYECAPMAFVTKHAGGYSSDGSHDILVLEPTTLAERVPLYLGSAGLVRELESLISA